MAPATPAILPVPNVAASAVVIACKGDTSPWTVLFRRENAPMVRRSIPPKRRSCTKRVRAVKYTPVKTSKSSIGQPQTMPESHSLNRRSPLHSAPPFRNGKGGRLTTPRALFQRMRALFS